MDPVSAIGIAAGASQLAEQAAGIAKTLYDYFRTVREAPKHSKELRIEALIVANILEDLTFCVILYRQMNQPLWANSSRLAAIPILCSSC
jgi:hypothetical protein